MRLRKIFFIAAAYVSLGTDSNSTMTVPTDEKLANGVIPHMEELIKPDVGKTGVAHSFPSLAKNLPPTGMRIIEDYMVQSKAAYEVVVGRIDISRKSGAVVHIEDGETDDFWHNGLAALDGVIPRFVLTRGGYWSVRKEITKRIWEAYKAKFFPEGPQRPEILTIHGDNKNDLGTWDKIEGEGIIPDSELGKLREKSLLLEADPEYIGEVSRAESALLKLMTDEPYTTLVVKAAPTRLAHLIVQVPGYANRITIVWTAAIARRKEGGFTPRFNYRRDLEAGDELLALGVPIILLSSALSFTETLAIVDKEHAPVFNKYSQWPSTSSGFDQLRKFTAAESEITKLLDRPTLNFMNKKIANSVVELQTLQREEDDTLKNVADVSKEKEEILEQIQGVENIHKPTKLPRLNEQLAAVNKNLAHFTKQLRTTLTKRKAHVARGLRWKTITDKEIHDGTYRDICAVDQLAHTLMVKELREKSVVSVMQVGLKRERDQDELLVTSHPASNGPVFICIEVDPKPLSGKMQEFIYSVLTEEPKVVSTSKTDKAATIHWGGAERQVKKRRTAKDELRTQRV